MGTSRQCRAEAPKDAAPALAKFYEAANAEQEKKSDEILTGMGRMM